jgi:hypothetical protein
MSKDIKKDKKEQFIANRKALIALSVVMRQLVEIGEADSVNEGLIDMYKSENEGVTEFKTFGEWKREGCTIKKGSKAFFVWGQLRKVSQVPEGSEEPDEYNYWPICYLFANTQVITAQEKAEHKKKTEQPETANAHPREFANLDEIL